MYFSMYNANEKKKLMDFKIVYCEVFMLLIQRNSPSELTVYIPMPVWNRFYVLFDCESSTVVATRFTLMKACVIVSGMRIKVKASLH